MKHSAQSFFFSLMMLIVAVMVLGQAEAATSQDEAVLHYVNQYRAKHGLSALSMDARMSQEAVYHSEAMAKGRIGFGHLGFEGRIKRLYRVIPNANGASENVAAGKWNAKQVVDGWMNSPGHRRNILGHYNITGIGIAHDSRGRTYYTQLFILKDGAKRATTAVTMHRSKRPFKFPWA